MVATRKRSGSHPPILWLFSQVATLTVSGSFWNVGKFVTLEVYGTDVTGAAGTQRQPDPDVVAVTLVIDKLSTGPAVGWIALASYYSTDDIVGFNVRSAANIGVMPGGDCVSCGMTVVILEWLVQATVVTCR